MRSYCQQPDACVAGKRGLCSRCHAESLLAQAERMRRLNADPEFAAKNAERMRRLNADPEFAAKHAERMRRLNAEGRAGRKRLPLTEE